MGERTANSDATGEVRGNILPVDDALLEELLVAARSISPMHWALVLILYRTGIELEALARLTWRDVYPNHVVWRPSRKKRDAVIRFEDEELAHAFRVFVTGQRKTSGKLDYWIEQVRRETGNPDLASVTAINLRLTYCARRLAEGWDPEEIIKKARLRRPLVHHVMEHVAGREVSGAATEAPLGGETDEGGA